MLHTRHHSEYRKTHWFLSVFSSIIREENYAGLPYPRCGNSGQHGPSSCLRSLKPRWEDRYDTNHYKQLSKNYNMQRDAWAALRICYWETKSDLGYQGLSWGTHVKPEIQRMYQGSNGSIPSEGIALGRSRVQRTLHTVLTYLKDVSHSWGRWSDRNRDKWTRSPRAV